MEKDEMNWVKNSRFFEAEGKKNLSINTLNI